MKYLFIAAVVLAISNNCQAQNDTSKVKDYIYDKTYKNIAAFFIKYHLERKTDFQNDGFLNQNTSKYFFDECLPDLGAKLDMEIIKLDWDYPIGGYTIYQIKINGLSFSNAKTGKSETIHSYDGPIDNPPGNNFLLCINKRGAIKFISGSYFLNDVSDDFKLNKNSPESYLKYLAYRTFQYQTNNIHFFKKSNQELYFAAYSDMFQQNVLIVVNENKPGRVDIKIMDKN